MYKVTTKKHKVILMVLLIILNFVIRIPSIPHEKGLDSFVIHSLANSVSIYGVANWWFSFLSVFGLYPYSMASSVPFILSGFAQLTNVNMETIILLFSFIIGIFSIFAVYVLGGVLSDNFMFKYSLALFYSISQGILVFSTWEISSRGPFIIFLPLFIYLLCRTKSNFTKMASLVFVLFVFLAATHHYFYFLLPICFLFIFIHIFNKTKMSNLNLPVTAFQLYISLAILATLLPFFTRSLIGGGSRYAWVIESVLICIRFLGPIFLFAVIGWVYLSLKANKNDNEWFILLIFLIFLPFLYSLKYGVYISLLTLVIFSTYAFNNLLNACGVNKIGIFVVILLILSFVSFSSYYNHYRTGSSESYWYMDEMSFTSSQWTKNFISTYERGFGIGTETWRIFALSNGHPIIPTQGAPVLAFELIDAKEIQMEKVNPTSSTYYFEGPYVVKPGTTISGKMNWFLTKNIDSELSQSTINKFNLSYAIEDTYAKPYPVSTSLRRTRSHLYSNGRINVWLI